MNTVRQTKKIYVGDSVGELDSGYIHVQISICNYWSE